MTKEATTVAQALGQPDITTDLVTLGAGVVALAFIFGFLFLMIKEFIPAFKAGVSAMIEMMEKMSSTLENLNKTMVSTQVNNTAALEALKQEVSTLATKLEYHSEAGRRIELSVGVLQTTVTQVQERVRACQGNRPANVRTRKGD